MSDSDISEFQGIMERHRAAPTRVLLEEEALHQSANVRASAKTEILRRDRDYAEKAERERRVFETALAQKRQDFEAALERQRQDFATALANKQLAAAQDVATATKRAFWAAVAAAIGALIQAGVAVFVILG